MGEWFKQLPAKLVAFWNKYSARQKVLFFSVLATVVITLVALVLLLNRTTYVTLSVFEDTAATSQAATLLDENNIKYKLSTDALTISVDENQVSKARLLLGQNGISTSVNKTDTDWLFDNSFNTTDSEKKLKEKINKQSTMAMDIAQIDGVAKASVTINIPDNTNTIYASDESVSVSIMITTNANFKQESVSAIAEYAKTCVGDADTKDITIIDNKGSLLFSGTNESTAVTGKQMVQQQVEEYYNSKLWNLMVNSGVYDEVSVSSNLDIQLSDKEVYNIEYYSNDEDDTGPKDTHYYYLAENTDGTGGVVGTDANGEEITDYDLLDTVNGESSVNVIKETYSTSYTETRTKEPVGQVNMANSTMAMYLTKYQIYKEDELKSQGKLQDMSYEEFKEANSETIETFNSPELIAMLSKATGIKETNIYIIERVVPIFYDAEKTSVPVRSIISIILAVLIGALLLFVVFKGMKPEEVVETEPELSVEQLLATTKENQTLDDIELGDQNAAKQQIEKFVDDNPEAVAALLRNWLNDDWD